MSELDNFLFVVALFIRQHFLSTTAITCSNFRLKMHKNVGIYVGIRIRFSKMLCSF